MRPSLASTVLLPAALFASPALAATPADMEPMTWLAVPGTKLRAVQADPEQYADLQGNGFWTIIAAWNGALLDTTRMRLVIWGGGHNDYYGNEMYAFDIGALAWERLTEPTVEWANCGDPNPDGTANSRHTFNGLAYIEHADRMFATGGALNCLSGGCGSDVTWEFDFDTRTWTDRMPQGTHSTGCSDNAAYDPGTGAVYFGDGGGLFAYSHDDNAWTQLSDDYIYEMTSVVDTTRGQLVMVGSGSVWSYDLAGGDFARQEWATTGGDAFIAGGGVGLAYDPVSDRIVGWSDGPVWVLDPESRAWTQYDVDGAPTPSINGTYGRWRYVPGVNAFVLVTDVDTDVHFFKLTEGGELPPPPPDGGSSSDDGSDATDDAGSAGDDAGSAGGDGAATTGPGAPGTDGDAPGGSTGGATATGGAAVPSDDAGTGCGCGSRESPAAWTWLPLLCLAARRERGRG